MSGSSQVKFFWSETKYASLISFSFLFFIIFTNILKVKVSSNKNYKMVDLVDIQSRFEFKIFYDSLFFEEVALEFQKSVLASRKNQTSKPEFIYLLDSEDEKKNWAHTIYFCFGMNRWLDLRNLPLFYIVMQFEPLCIRGLQSENYLVILKKSLAIFEYSSNNLCVYQEFNIPRDKVFLMQVGYAQNAPEQCAEHIVPKKLEKGIATTKDVDILFFGTQTPYRLEIIDKLKRRYPTKNIQIFDNIWGKVRDNIVKRSKIVLNIHTEKQKKFPLETPRLLYLSRFNVHIVSEHCGDIEMENRWKHRICFSDTEFSILNKLFDTEYNYEYVSQKLNHLNNLKTIESPGDSQTFGLLSTCQRQVVPLGLGVPLHLGVPLRLGDLDQRTGKSLLNFPDPPKLKSCPTMELSSLTQKECVSPDSDVCLLGSQKLVTSLETNVTECYESLFKSLCPVFENKFADFCETMRTNHRFLNQTSKVNPEIKQKNLFNKQLKWFDQDIDVFEPVDFNDPQIPDVSLVKLESLPNVSIITLTTQSRLDKWKDLMIWNNRQRIYDRRKLEWIIVIEKPSKLEQKRFHQIQTELNSYVLKPVFLFYENRHKEIYHQITEKRNLALERCSHEYIDIMDDDDIEIPDSLKIKIVLLETYKENKSCVGSKSIMCLDLNNEVLFIKNAVFPTESTLTFRKSFAKSGFSPSIHGEGSLIVLSQINKVINIPSSLNLIAITHKTNLTGGSRQFDSSRETFPPKSSPEKQISDSTSESRLKLLEKSLGMFISPQHLNSLFRCLFA